MSSNEPRGLLRCLPLLVIVPQATLAAFIPALPTIGRDLSGSTESADMTLVLYMAGYAVSMALAGTLATRFGLKRVQLAGLALHVAASLVCVFAPTLTVLSMGRVGQAVGGGFGTVLARLYVHEALSQRQRLLALTQLSTAIAVTPAITPVVTGLALERIPWRWVPALLALLGLIVFVVAAFTLPQDTRDTPPPVPVRNTVHSSNFWAWTAAISLAWCSYFAFTTYGSSVLQTGLGLSSGWFGACYAVVVIGYVVGSTLARRGTGPLTARLRTAAVWAVTAAVVMVVASLIWPQQPLSVVLPMALCMVGIGAIFPLSQAGMLADAGAAARPASSIFFTTQMAAGAVYTGLLSVVPLTSTWTLSVVVLAPATALTVLALTRSRNTAPVEASSVNQDPAVAAR